MQTDADRPRRRRTPDGPQDEPPSPPRAGSDGERLARNHHRHRCSRGQTVDVLTAADNGRENFHVAAVVTTSANGGWSARLPGGPSRLVEATYAGASSTESAVSAPVQTRRSSQSAVARATTPRRVPWGGIIHLTGRLEGRLPSPRRRAGAAAHRPGHLRARPMAYANTSLATAGSRPTTHFGAGRAIGQPIVLVSDRVAADGRLSLRTGRQPPALRERRRAPSAAAICPRPPASVDDPRGTTPRRTRR